MNEFDKLMKTCEVFAKLAMNDGKSKVASIGKSLSKKYAQLAGQPQVAPFSTMPAAPNADLQAKMNTALQPFGYHIPVGAEIRVLPSANVVDVPIVAGEGAKWQGTGHQGNEIAKLLAPLAPAGMKVNPTITM